MAVGGSSVSYRPAGSSTRRRAHSSRSARPRSRAATSTSVKSRVASPAHADRLRSIDFAFELNLARRLVVPQPQAGRGAEERRGQIVLGEPVQLPPAGAGRAERVAELPGEPLQHADAGTLRRIVPPRAPGHMLPRTDLSPGRPAGSRPPPASPRRPPSRPRGRCFPPRRRGPRTGTPRRPRPRPSRQSMAITVSRRERATPFVVSVFPAQRRLAVDVSSAMTTQSPHVATERACSTMSCGRWFMPLPPPC